MKDWKKPGFGRAFFMRGLHPDWCGTRHHGITAMAWVSGDPVAGARVSTG